MGPGEAGGGHGGPSAGRGVGPPLSAHCCSGTPSKGPAEEGQTLDPSETVTGRASWDSGREGREWHLCFVWDKHAGTVLLPAECPGWGLGVDGTAAVTRPGTAPPAEGPRDQLVVLHSLPWRELGSWEDGAPPWPPKEAVRWGWVSV